MKKILFIILISLSFNLILKAECTYTDKVNLITLSSYVESGYEHTIDNTFNLTFYNVVDKLSLEYNNITYPSTNTPIVIPSLTEGSSIKVKLKGSTQSACSDLDLRVINITIPYVNPFYNDNRCIGHEKLNVCSNEFLEYKITESEFNRLINSVIDKKSDELIDEEIPKEETKLITKIIAFIKKTWIPLLLIVVSTLITYSIFSAIYRKVRHGL